MPRIARFTIDSIAELTRQLRFAPAEARAKQMSSAEQFAVEVRRDLLYPEDFVIFRITGYRPQRIDNPAMFVGEALLGDLANFIQLLSDGLKLPPDYQGRTAVPLDTVAARLKVATKTLQRYRKRGLICHYIDFGDGEQRLACFEDSLERFARSHESQLRCASGFTRISESTSRAIIEEAKVLRAEQGLSLNEAALQLASKHGRAHETVRLLLRRHDRSNNAPIFTERGPLTDRDGQVLYRAWRWGVPVAEMSRRFGRTPTSIHRAINRHRGNLLRGLELTHVELPTFLRKDAAEVILGVPVVRTGFDDAVPPQDALGLLKAVREVKQDDETEVALLAAYNFLKRRAAADIAKLGQWPLSTELDAIETDLRWAGCIKRRMLFLGLGTAIGRIEQNLHRPLVQQPSPQIIEAINTAVSITSSVVETIDPSRGQRLTRLTAYAADRTLARVHDVEHPGRAAARHGDTIAMNDPFRPFLHGSVFLEPRPAIRHALPRVEPAQSKLVAARYGWDGGRPQSIAMLAARFGAHPSTMSRRLSKIEAELLKFVREQKNSPADR